MGAPCELPLGWGWQKATVAEAGEEDPTDWARHGPDPTVHFIYLNYSSQHGEYDWAKGIISSIFWASYPLLCRLPLKQPQIRCLPLPSITFPMMGTCLPLQPPFPPSCPLPTLRSSSKTPYQAESDVGAFCSYFSSVGNAFPSLPLIFTWKMPA